LRKRKINEKEERKEKKWLVGEINGKREKD
jgi:hypothetical protein